MKISDMRPFVRQAIAAKMSLGRYISYKLRTRDHRLFYIMGGTGNIVIEDESYPLKAGMIVLLRSGTEYMWQLGNVRYLAINFDYTSEHRHIRRSFHVERSEVVDSVLEPNVSFDDAEVLNKPVVLYDAAALESAVMGIVGEFSVRCEWSDEYISALMRALVISVARRCSAPQDARIPNGVREVISYIQSNYTKPIRNTDISDALHLNPSYMNRMFKAHTGISVRAFLIDYRINAATDLILGGELSVSELASAVGFTDVPHFIKTFKAHTGKTPKEYGRSE